MPKKKRDSALYRRGGRERGQFECWLAWDRRADGSLRSPYPAVFWYDRERRRHRSASTGTADLEAAKRFTDAFFLEHSTGRSTCHACGQPINSAAGHLVTAAIANYQLEHGDNQKSAKAIAARLAHVVDYIATLPDPGVTCDQVDERWIGRFRSWAEKRPVVGQQGKSRKRSLSTIETSVIQLQAAINHAWKRGDTRAAARFKPQPIRELNRTPQHRSGIDQLAAMFRYCVDPTPMKGKPWSDEIRKARTRERASLHRFLILSVATLGRPDAVHDVSLKPERRQWNSQARILALNPAGRRQTQKYRATVPIGWAVARHLDEAAGRKKPGFFVGVKSVRKAWEAMASELGLPIAGEAGTKLVRRSVAEILRQRLPSEAWGEIEMFLGHARFDAVSDLYAPFKPDYLRRALGAIESVIDEIEKAVPGALFRTCTGVGGEVIPMVRAGGA